MEDSLKERLVDEEEGHEKSVDDKETDDSGAKKPKDKLISRGPLMTILLFAFGPFMAEICGAAYTIIDSFWVSKVCGDNGLAVMSFTIILDGLGRSFGMFLSVAASSQLAKLRGEGELGSIPQVFADLFRTCFVFGLICPAILLPCVDPMLVFFDADDEIKRLGVSYMTPVLGGAVISCLNLFLCGVLQSEGRSVMYGAVQVSAFMLNALVFDPMFMLWFKWEMFGAGIATICSEALPMLVVAVMFFCGRFETKVTRSEMLGKPSRYTFSALKTGLTQFISRICDCIPSFFSRKYVSDCAMASGRYAEVLAAYNVVVRMWRLVASYTVAVSVTLLPAASYAIGGSLYDRVLKLVGSATLLTFIWCIVMEVVLCLFGRYIAMIFSDEGSFLDTTAKMLWIANLLCCVMGSRHIARTVLQATRHNIMAITLSVFTQFLPIPLFGSILYFTDKSKDIYRLMYMYTISEAFSLIMCSVVIAWTTWKLVLQCRDQKTSLQSHSDGDVL